MYKGLKYFKLYGDSRDWDRYWDLFQQYGHCIAIARTNFTEDEEPVYTRSNYQILQTMDLPYADFRRLADESVYWINSVPKDFPTLNRAYVSLSFWKRAEED
jgi:hypothetical protein